MAEAIRAAAPAAPAAQPHTDPDTATAVAGLRAFVAADPVAFYKANKDLPVGWVVEDGRTFYRPPLGGVAGVIESQEIVSRMLADYDALLAEPGWEAAR